MPKLLLLSVSRVLFQKRREPDKVRDEVKRIDDFGNSLNQYRLSAWCARTGARQWDRPAQRGAGQPAEGRQPSFG